MVQGIFQSSLLIPPCNVTRHLAFSLQLTEKQICIYLAMPYSTPQRQHSKAAMEEMSSYQCDYSICVMTVRVSIHIQPTCVVTHSILLRCCSGLQFPKVINMRHKEQTHHPTKGFLISVHLPTLLEDHPSATVPLAETAFQSHFAICKTC